MPKLACPCGEVLDLSQVAARDAAVLIALAEWDAVVAALAAAAEQAGIGDPVLLGEALSDALAGFGDEVYRCPRCGRLLIVERVSGVAEVYERRAGPAQQEPGPEL